MNNIAIGGLTGQYITAVANQGYIYVSNDGGINWTTITSIPSSTYSGTNATNRFWYGVSMTSSGQYQTIADNVGYIFVSSNYGVNWRQEMSDVTRNWWSVSISSLTGQYQSACVNNSSSNGYIYVSNDYGNTWIAKVTDLSRQWYSISVSETGQYQTAVVYGGSIYCSINYGYTWIIKDEPNLRNWTSVSVSGTGIYQTALDYTIYPSQNENVIFRSITTVNSNLWNLQESSLIATSAATSGVQAVSFNTTSDYRIKTDVTSNLPNTLDNLNPVFYKNILSNKYDMGFIAHELQKEFPFLVNGEKDGPNNQSVNYTGLIALLVKEIQDLKKRVEILELEKK